MMNLEDFILDAPRPLSGSSFAEYLICKRKAWMSLNLNNKAKAEDPSYLRFVKRDGIEFEKQMYNAPPLAFGFLVPQSGTPDIRLKNTTEAIKTGHPYILQAYFSADGFVGIADILERIDSTDAPLGFYYQVGDIKYSKSVHTSHIFQIMFYNDLLTTIQDFKASKGFIITEKGERNNIDYFYSDPIYTKVKAHLENIRVFSVEDLETYLPPYLKKACQSCPFRLLCMPCLLEKKDISLIPNLSQQQRDKLFASGLTRYDQILEAPLPPTGIPDDEYSLLRKYAINIDKSYPLFTEQLSLDAASSMKPVALTLNRVHTDEYEIQNIHMEVDGVPHSWVVENFESFFQLISTSQTPLISYGLDYILLGIQLRKFTQEHRIIHYDLLKIIENYVHFPFWGLELESLFNQISVGTIPLHPSPPLSGNKRLHAVKTILQWLTKGIS